MVQAKHPDPFALGKVRRELRPLLSPLLCHVHQALGKLRKGQEQVAGQVLRFSQVRGDGGGIEPGFEVERVGVGFGVGELRRE